MNSNTPYCLMPWIHFHAGDDGQCKACCVANIPFGDINTQSFDEIWNGEKINHLREKFAAGTQDKRCAHCYKLEASGGKSIRQETFEKFGDIDIHKNPPKTPIYFDIRFSNVCNLKCRTCWHGASSSWFNDAKVLGTNKGHQAIIKNIQEFEYFIQELGPSLLQAREIYLAGGEPLVTEQHYQLLMWLIENKATHIHLRYNTNFTTLKYKEHHVLELWKHFDSIEVLASLDATEKLGSYIRTGSEWEKIVANYHKIKSYNNVVFKISPTISVLNITALPQLFTECIRLGMITEDEMYINILERPIHYNIQILPTETKEKINAQFKAFSPTLQSPKAKAQFEEILRYMNALDLSKHWPKFEIENGKIDQLRNENFPLKL